MFPTRIMMCIEDPGTDTGLEAVGALVRRFSASLVLFHAERAGWRDVQPMAPEREAHPEARSLEKLTSHPALKGLLVETCFAKEPLDIIESALECAEARKIDLVVLPTHARTGVDRFIFGSVTERMIRSCKVPVLTLDLERLKSGGGSVDFDMVLAPVDFSPISDTAVPMAATLAERFNAPLHLLHVVEDYYVAAYPMAGVPSVVDFQPALTETARQHLSRLENRISTRSSIRVSSSVEVGRLVDQVRDHVTLTKNPLVVLATAGRDSVGDWILGSHAERLLRAGKCSILALPPRFLHKSV